MSDCDYLIVGAGSAGATLAGRLAEDPRLRVTLIEAGPKGAWPWTTIPIGYGMTYYHPEVNWRFQSQPIPGFGGRVTYVPRGKALGGSSAINAMVYSRGQPADYAAWEAAGNPGWGWDAVLAAYRRIEDHALGASAVHGAGGPLHVSDVSRDVHALTRACVGAAVELGQTETADLNGASIEGVGYYQITTRHGRRESAATAFLKPRQNLRIVTGAMARRLVFEGRRAVGVELANGTVERGGRVVLSAGAIGSPVLLQLSGIGPGAVLQRLGVPVLRESAAVGRNLQDHLCYDHVYRTRVPSLNQVLGTRIGRLMAGIQYVLTRRGPLAMSVNQGGGYFRTGPGRNHPNMQLYFSPLSYERQLPGVRRMTAADTFPGMLMSVSNCRPKSLGWVEAASPDPAAMPLIQPNFLDHPDDIAEMVEGARFLRALAASDTLKPLIEEELHPGPSTLGDEAFAADIRARSYSVFHPCGSNRMGPDPATSVVSPRLAVHGVENLWIADASIFPEITSGNINAPSIMVGEMAAKILREAP